MTTRSFRSLVLLSWLLSFFGALVFALSLGAPSATASASASGTYRVMIPIIIASSSTKEKSDPASSFENQVVVLTNALRQKHGCPALQVSPELTVAARLHSQEMANHNYFEHTDLGGHLPDWRAQQAGYIGLAGWENIAAGYTTAEDVVGGWYNETPPNDGHRRNILNCALTSIGVGYATNASSDYGTYWTQDFGE